MKLNISSKTYEPQWIKFKDCELLLDPYPVGRTDLLLSSDFSMVISGKQRREIFMYSVKGWKYIVDLNGVDIPCTNENKGVVFDYNLSGIAGFVYTYNSEFDATVKEEFSNLQPGQDGDLTEKTKPAEIVEGQSRTDL